MWILSIDAGEGDVNVLTPDPRLEYKKPFKGEVKMLGGGG